MASTSEAQAYLMENIHLCETHTEQPGYNHPPQTHQETVNVQPVYYTQMYPHINAQQAGSTVVLVVSSSFIRLINFIIAVMYIEVSYLSLFYTSQFSRVECNSN